MLNVAFLTINELERIGEKAPMPDLRYHPGIYLKVLNRTTKKLTQFPSREFNRGSSEYKSEMLYLSQRIPFLFMATRHRHMNPVYNLPNILLECILILSHRFA
jgi:hypothetical protein